MAELRAAGVDAYGITTTGPRHQPGPDVRFAELLTHLRAVDDDALGAVVLAGGTVMLAPRTPSPPWWRSWDASPTTVVVVSEAPWWWRLRLGAVNADLALGPTARPRHMAARLSRGRTGGNGAVRPRRAELPRRGPGPAVRLGLVVPRYGVDVVGGIEHWLRLLCEHLVAMKGWDVEVFTTCAVSAATWADELAPGDSELAGVTVHRRRSVSGRDPRSGELNLLIRRSPAVVPDALAHRFVDLVGPVCPDVLDDAAASDVDLVAVTPYLFWPAVHATPRLGRRVIFHSAAHDEPELHLAIMRGVFGAAGGFAYNSYSEQALVERTFPVAHLPAAVIGATVVEGTGDPDRGSGRARTRPGGAVRAVCGSGRTGQRITRPGRVVAAVPRPAARCSPTRAAGPRARSPRRRRRRRGGGPPARRR